MSVEFTLTASQKMLQSKARQFANDTLAGAKASCEALATPEERFQATRPVYEAMIAGGYLRACIPSGLGGESSGLVDVAVLCEEFYKVDPSLTLTLLGTVLGLMPVLLGGSPQQCQRFLAPFLATQGAPLAAFASTEPGGSANVEDGAPAEGVRTTATRLDGEWVINGRKQWISSATGWDGLGADLLCVVCRTDPAAAPHQAVSVLAVTRPMPGLVLEQLQHSMGHRAHCLPRFRLENVRVPLDHLLAAEGKGLELRTASFLGTAAVVGVFGVALMQAAFEFALRFAKTERRGGVRPIIDHQAVGYALADAKMNLEAARSLSWRACAALDAQHASAYELALAAKVFGSEAAVRTITNLISVVGVDSYDMALPLAGLLQDAIALPIFDGGNMGVRRRQYHQLLESPDYNPLMTIPS